MELFGLDSKRYEWSVFDHHVWVFDLNSIRCIQFKMQSVKLSGWGKRHIPESICDFYSSSFFLPYVMNLYAGLNWLLFLFWCFKCVINHFNRITCYTSHCSAVNRVGRIGKPECVNSTISWILMPTRASTFYNGNSDSEIPMFCCKLVDVL